MEARRKIVHILTFLLALSLRWLSPGWAVFLIFATLIFNLHFIPRILRSVYRDRSSGVDRGIILFPISLLLLVLLFGRQLWIVAAGWALLAVGDGFATLIGQYFPVSQLPWNERKSWGGLLAFLIFGFPALWFAMWWCYAPFSGWVLLSVAAVVTLVCALIETLPMELDDNLRVPLTGGILVYLAALSASSVPYFISEELNPLILWGGILLNLGGALLGYFLQTLSISGVFAAALVGALVFIFQPFGWILLVLFFVLGNGATRLRLLRSTQSPSQRAYLGRRRMGQVLAKGAAAGVFAYLAACTPYSGLFRLALVASLAAALADTIETEIGILAGRKPFLPSSFRPAEPGTPGAVTLEGTCAGLLAAVLLGAVSVALGLIPWKAVTIVLMASFAGTFLESWVGSHPPRRKLWGSGGLNLLATTVSGLAAIGLRLLFPTL